MKQPTKCRPITVLPMKSYTTDFTSAKSVPGGFLKNSRNSTRVAVWTHVTAFRTGIMWKSMPCERTATGGKTWNHRYELLVQVTYSSLEYEIRFLFIQIRLQKCISTFCSFQSKQHYHFGVKVTAEINFGSSGTNDRSSLAGQVVAKGSDGVHGQV
jgi:hypothetical protein